MICRNCGHKIAYLSRTDEWYHFIKICGVATRTKHCKVGCGCMDAVPFKLYIGV